MIIDSEHRVVHFDPDGEVTAPFTGIIDAIRGRDLYGTAQQHLLYDAGLTIQEVAMAFDAIVKLGQEEEEAS